MSEEAGRKPPAAALVLAALRAPFTAASALPALIAAAWAWQRGSSLRQRSRGYGRSSHSVMTLAGRSPMAGLRPPGEDLLRAADRANSARRAKPPPRYTRVLAPATGTCRSPSPALTGCL